MKIANVFLGKKLGGIEQAFLDYTEALTAKGYDVVDFVHKDGVLKNKIPSGVSKRELPFRKRSPLTVFVFDTGDCPKRPCSRFFRSG